MCLREEASVGEAIVITSGKGGVGKTTTTANLGTALALQGKKVCLVDTDIGLRNLDVILGLENRIIYDLVDVVEGRCKIHQALIKDKRVDEKLFYYLFAQTTDKNAVTPEQMKSLVEELKRDYDYVLIDCPAELSKATVTLLLVQIMRLLSQHLKFLLFVMQIVLLVYWSRKR